MNKKNLRIKDKSDDLFIDDDDYKYINNNKKDKKIEDIKIEDKKDIKIEDKLNEIFVNNFMLKELDKNNRLKEKQIEILKSVLIDKKDTIGIMATGYGKSICYQLPYKYYNGTKNIIIISPLISLMQDQLYKLEQMNIPVFTFHSGIDSKTKLDIKNKLTLDDKCKILYLTPEYLVKSQNFIESLYEEDKIGLIAIDEAHCMSSWGNDFRQDYKTLYLAKEWAPNVPILCLTATATKHVEEDIIKFMKFNNPKIIKTSFNRENLYIKVSQRPSKIIDIKNLLDNYILNNNSNISKSIIIYCKTRKDVDKITKELKTNNYSVSAYHAGLSNDERQEVQTDFTEEKINIIVATNAFGMGIDKVVHLVIHWGCPENIENYYQEIGRAGRDGKKSECYLYFDKSDFKVNRFFLKNIKNSELKNYKDEQICCMEQICYINRCRKQYILEYFGEKIDKCNNCDNCLEQKISDHNTVLNIIYPLYMIVKTVFLGKCKLGSNKIMLILKGSKNKIIDKMITFNTYGLCKNLADDEIKSLIRLLICNKYLKEVTIQNGFGTYLDASEELIYWYLNIDKLVKEKKCLLSYDNIIDTLKMSPLEITIPTTINNLSKIKYESIEDKLINEFKDEL